MKISIITFIISCTPMIALSQAIEIQGKINYKSKGIPNATVIIKESKQSIQSDSSGYFSLKINSKKTCTLRVQHLGFAIWENEIPPHKWKDTVQIELQPEVNYLDEIVVTDVSSSSKIKENPLSIQTINAQQIENASESNIVDALVKYSPGLSAVKTGPNVSKPFIRGLGYNRILTLYDGIRQEGQQWGDEHGLEVDAYQIQKAEIIKGPASLMFGSDALAGVVSLFPFIPQKSDGKIKAKMIGEYQTNHGLIGNSISIYTKKQHWFYTLSGSYKLAKNYQNPIDRLVYLSNFNEKNFAFLGGYTSNRGYSHFGITSFNNTQGIPDGSRTLLDRKFTKQIFEAENDQLDERPIVSEKELNTYQVPLLSQQIQHYNFYSKHQYAIKNGQLNALIAFQNNSRKEFNHPTAPQQAGMYVKLKTLNYSANYTYKFTNELENSFGINGMWQSNQHQNATDFPIPNYQLNEIGFFNFSKWKKEKWTLSGGIRYDQRHVHWNNFYTETEQSTGFERQAQQGNDATELPFPAFQKIFYGWSGSLGGTYQINNQMSIKANIGRGYRAPNITEIASNGLDPGAHIIYLGNRSFKPEFSFQQDLGWLATLNNFSFELNIFNNHIQNFIYQNLVTADNGSILLDAQGNKTYQYQATKAQLYGAEGNISIHPLAWKNFESTHQFSIVYGFNRDSKFKNSGNLGLYLPLIPPFQTNHTFSYFIHTHRSKFTTIQPQIAWEYSAAQHRYLALNQTETFTDGYHLWHLGLQTALKISPNKTLLIHLNVQNIFNKAYQSHLSRLKYFENNPNTSPHNGIYNMGRNIAFKLRMEF